MGALCGSWPHCRKRPMRGRRFCKEHQAVMDRVAAEYKGGKKKRLVDNIIKPKPPANPSKPKSLIYREKMLEGLRAGPKTSGELAACCGVSKSDSTMLRARDKLIRDGTIKRYKGDGVERLVNNEQAWELAA
jgi:hypothetical protein